LDRRRPAWCGSGQLWRSPANGQTADRPPAAPQEDDFQLARRLQEQERAFYLLQGDAGYE
jgi:hypothetical protein